MSEPAEPTPAPGGCDDTGSPESSTDDPLKSPAPAPQPTDGQADSSSESDDNKSTSSCEPERESSEEISAAMSEEGKPEASPPPRSPRPCNDEIVPDPPTSGDESEERSEAQDVQPYPELAPTAFCFLKQTHKPRLWCFSGQVRNQDKSIALSCNARCQMATLWFWFTSFLRSLFMMFWSIELPHFPAI
uniref:Uncharacterized protein n=1 Tax=Branchiostoma floridae TaxID=7739 RepID=C3Z6V0_BRAFL|eukprot:XP_002595534.1 hypothetical protein BRAFLDRAFT_64588 [Branchiostoma floridae]